MTTEQEQTTKQTDELLEAGWRMTLPEVFRPAAERHGMNAFKIAYAIGAVRETLTLLAGITMKANVQRAVQICAESASQLAAYSMELHKLDQTKISEICLDIERAAQLGAATMQEPGNKIILPS